VRCSGGRALKPEDNVGRPIELKPTRILMMLKCYVHFSRYIMIKVSQLGTFSLVDI